MQLLDGGWIYSATDLVARMECEHRTALDLASKGGVLPVEVVRAPPEGMAQLAGQHGDLHEQRVLEILRTRYARIVEIDQPHNTRHALRQAAADTAAALAQGVDVVYQACFFDEHFRGHADFVIKGEGGYEVYDSKLARHVKPGALLQLAAYSEQLHRLGHPMPRQMHVWLGNDEVVSCSVDDVLPKLRQVRADILAQIAAGPMVPTPLWGDKRSSCGTCGWSHVCAEGRDIDRDLSLVAGMRGDQRGKLRDAGIQTLEQLAAAPDSQCPHTLGFESFDRLRAQAVLQARQDASRSDLADTGAVTSEHFSHVGLRLLPPASQGDVWFDMEGDPFAEQGQGLEYLFGYTTIDQRGEDDPDFTPIWGHSPDAEKAAFEKFVDAMQERIRRWPDMHIYHYANYERAALSRLAGRYGTRERVIDDWLRCGRLVDLMKVFKGSFRVSQRSYSIKKLEPLYGLMRTEDIVTAGDSVVDYEAYLGLLATGRQFDAQAKLDAIAAYNRVDCESTLQLDRWMRPYSDSLRIIDALDDSASVNSGAGEGWQQSQPDDAEYDILLDGIPETNRTPEQQGRAMMRAAVGYFRREAKPQWWEHYARLDAAQDDWERDRDVLVVESGTAGPWVAKRANYHRTMQLVLRESDWRDYTPGDEIYLVYDQPTEAMAVGAIEGRGWTEAKVDRLDGNVLHVKSETVSMAYAPHPELPVAVFPTATVRNGALAESACEFADRWVVELPEAPRAAVTDLLLRRPPRLRAGGVLPRSGNHSADLQAALRDLDDSYIAVQGPPGAGKTHLAAEVITSLVQSGWRIGVVSQSHKAVENLMDKAIELGLAGDLVAKKPKGRAAKAYHATMPDQLLSRLPAGIGALVGGTAWTYCGARMRDHPPLDLLVIDEAGQYSLGFTVALWQAAGNLLLLGDPQQLPQVSQGTHPEPIDVAALAWLADGEAVLPARYGYFLDESRRMHSGVADVVSRLAYDRQLRAHADADRRSLRDVDPGVRGIAVHHVHNTVRAEEEVAVCVDLVKQHLDHQWTDNGETRPLGQADIMIVAPYNAQVDAIRRALSAEGLGDVPVGTVDKFQGQEAPVVIVSMTSSSREDIPRGMGFVLSRNRLNVAISRAQWASYVTYSPALADHAPGTADELVLLGAFLGAVTPEVVAES